MDAEIREDVTDWETESVADGYAGLRALADESFSGAVAAGAAWAFLLNGRVVGVVDGDISEFEGASLTAHCAPEGPVALLYAMREADGETRAQYYTNETPLSEVDETLSSGGFTGYVELSENVLSGDYYVLYHGGESSSVAFVGNSRRLYTGEEAFERAADEVGIYEVRDVDVDVVDVPGASDSGASSSVGAGSGAEAPPGANADESRRDSDADTDSRDVAAAGTPDVVVDPATDEADPAPAERPADPAAGVGDDESAAPAGASEASTHDEPIDDEAAAGATDTGDTDPSPEPTDTERADGTEVPDATPSVDPDATDDTPGDDAPAAPSESTAGTDEASTVAQPPDGEDVFDEEEEWRETQVIPSLSPDETGVEGGAGASADQESTELAGEPSAGTEEPRPEEAGPRTPEKTGDAGTEEAPSESGAAATGDRPDAGGAGAPTPEQTAGDTAEESEDVAKLRAERDDLADRLSALRDEREEYTAEISRLRSRVTELEAELEELRAGGATGSSGGSTMSPSEARAGTNLFVRYRSKSDPTLADLHEGVTDREAVDENLRLEHHTTFDTEGLTVNGQPFEAFLEETTEYRFVRWVVRELLDEIRETGNEATMEGLFDAIPEIDRAELDGSVAVGVEQDATDSPERRQFDVVLRDRMGDPLVVTDINADRSAATGNTVRSLIDGAKQTGESNDTLGAAVFVTASFFEPDALEAVDAVTGGGLFGRSKHKSFVRLSRKRGFHLCLVETRDRNFHLNVPEL